MSRRHWIIIAAMALGFGLAGGYLLGHRSADQRDRAASSEATNKPEERKILYWRDPMVPGAKFDKPGKSPFMDMELVPVYASEEGRAAVQIDSTVAQNLGIRLGKVEQQALEQRVHTVGTVGADDRRIQVVQTRVTGTVTRLHVRAPLVHVKQGEPLAEIVSPDWISAQQEYLALLDAKSASSQSIRAAARERLQVLGVPEPTVRAIESARRVNATTSVHAPIDGVITQLATREGAAFAAGSMLFEITDLRSVWVNAQIPESQIASVTRGATARVAATAWPGKNFEGRVIALLPDVDPQTRTIGARVEVKNEDELLVPGMYVSVEFADTGGSDQLVVPTEAVIMTGERTVVIVAREGGGFDVANVTIGTEAHGVSAVLSGLTEGQSVVLSGQFLIDSEASLKATINRMEVDGTTKTGQMSPSAMDIPMSTEKTYSAVGKIVALFDDQITIAHGPVADLQWPAMTMGFKRPDEGGVPAQLEVGDQVNFSFSQSPQGGFQIVQISRVSGPVPEKRSEPEQRR